VVQQVPEHAAGQREVDRHDRQQQPLGALYKIGDAQFHRMVILVCPVLIAVGLFGILLNGKLYERSRRHSSYPHGYLEELSALFQQAGFHSLWNIQNESRAQHRSRFWFWRWWRLHWGWFAINLIFVGVGVGLLVSVLFDWPSVTQAAPPH
jgi:hypothetical protein